MSEPRRRRADVRVAVVPIHAPRLQHAIRVAVLTGPADVVHDFVTAVLDDGLSNPPADIVERLVPRHLRPFAGSPVAVALERIENAIASLELVLRHDALLARAAPAARLQRRCLA